MGMKMTSFSLYLLESAACLALFYMGFRLFLRRETYFKLNRVYLVCSLITSLMLPAFKITSPIFTARASAPMSLLPPSAAPIKTWGLGETLLLLYAVGAGVFLTRFILHIIKLYFVVKKYRTTRLNGVKIVSVDKDFSPFSFLNYIFINDKKTSEHNMRRIIAHEEIHIKQYHTFDILLIELITVLQWFNPFVWPYKKSLQETHEFLADYGVIAQGFSTAKYQLLMFEQQVGVKLLEFTNNFKQSQIKRRITMMSKIKSRGAAKLKLLLIVPMATLLMLVFAEPKSADPQVAESLSADMLGIKVTAKTALSANQEADKKNEEELKKQMKKVKARLETLKKEEHLIREKMDATENPKKKAEIKSLLKDVLTMQKVMAEALEKGVLPPPPPSEKKLKEEYKHLSEKEEAIRTELDKITDPKEKSELKTALVEVMNKQKKIKAYLAKSNGPSGLDFKIDDLKKEYITLEKKAEELRKQLKSTDDPDVKAKCKQMLSEIQKKQQWIKQKATALKAGKEGKTIK